MVANSLCLCLCDIAISNTHSASSDNTWLSFHVSVCSTPGLDTVTPEYCSSEPFDLCLMCKALQKLTLLPSSRSCVRSVETWCSLSLYRELLQYQVKQPTGISWQFFAEKGTRKYNYHVHCVIWNSFSSVPPTHHSPHSDTNSFSASQEISCILRNPKYRYPTQYTPPLIPAPSQINPVHVLPSCFIMMNFNINLPPTPRYPPVSFPAPLLPSLTCYMLVPSYSHFIPHSSNI